MRYCGFASYTQTLPVGVTEEPCRVSITDCANMIQKKTMILEDGRSHQIEVPGETQLFMQVAGSEVISDREMRCQGESRYINGH